MAISEALDNPALTEHDVCESVAVAVPVEDVSSIPFAVVSTPATTGQTSPMASTPEQQKASQPDVLASSTSSAEEAAGSSPPSSSSPSLTTTLDASSQMRRSVSAASSVSSVSGRSTSSSRLSDSALSVKRRGYARPQATTFAESAKARESVMSLGSIAHLQYYFARTGLLDGKGAQFAKKTPDFKRVGGIQRSSSAGPSLTTELSLSPDQSTYAFSDSGLNESPVEQTEDAAWDRELAMLPPTVSTYNQRPAYVAPPPDLTMLRRELTEALEDALKVVKESDKSTEDTQGWFEIQGLHLLDITTLAIRAAKNYYTAHSQYQRLHSIKSERQIRSELYQVLEILKRMATRNFAGGLRQAEKVGILTWIVGISELIQTEIDQEKLEAEEREKWVWRTGDWTGRERQREYEFIKSFIENPEALPEWLEPSPTDDAALPTPFLKYLQNGLQLVKLHNVLVGKSRRQFEEIKVFHTDTQKPYRCAENLRFWIKAAQLRWEINLRVDPAEVMAVVQGTSAAAWRRFDGLVLLWSKGVREELSAEWAEQVKRVPPRLKVEAEPEVRVPVPVESSCRTEGAADRVASHD